MAGIYAGSGLRTSFVWSCLRQVWVGAGRQRGLALGADKDKLGLSFASHVFQHFRPTERGFFLSRLGQRRWRWMIRCRRVCAWRGLQFLVLTTDDCVCQRSHLSNVLLRITSLRSNGWGRAPTRS